MAIYYVNSLTGLDTNDGLSYSSAFKTLQALFDSITQFTEDTIVNLDEGVYTCDNTFHSKGKANIALTILGKGSSTRLKPDTYWGQITFGEYVGVAKSTLNICKLIFDMTNMVGVENVQAIRGYFSLYNVVIDVPVAPIRSGKGMFSTTRDSVYTFKNCLASSSNAIYIWSYETVAMLNNCYGKFQNATLSSSKDFVQNNCFFTNTPKVNNDYNITDENIPKTVGLYHGMYSWSSPILLKKDNQYFSINDILYNTETQSYNPLSFLDYSQAFQLYKLFESVSINGETFKPIDKFDNFQILTSDANSKYKIKAVEVNKQLIVANDDIFTSVASYIDYFKLMSNVTDTNSVKLALSTDSGSTWKTWNAETNNFENLSLIIPTTPYKQMAESELIEWNDAMEVISINGIDATTFNELDFNLLNSKTIRFAYVLSRPTYLDKAETSELQWQFDAKGNLQKMTDSECIVSVYDQQVKVKSLIENPIIKVNLMV